MLRYVEESLAQQELLVQQQEGFGFFAPFVFGSWVGGEDGLESDLGGGLGAGLLWARQKKAVTEEDFGLEGFDRAVLGSGTWEEEVSSGRGTLLPETGDTVLGGDGVALWGQGTGVALEDTAWRMEEQILEMAVVNPLVSSLKGERGTLFLEEGQSAEVLPKEVGFGEVLPREVGFGEVLPSEVGFGQVLPEEVGFGEVLPSEVGFGELMPREVGFGEVMPREVGFGEVMPKEVGFGEVMPSEVGFGEVLPSEVCFGELLPREVGFGEVLPSEVGDGQLLGQKQRGTGILADSDGLSYQEDSPLGGVLPWGGRDIVGAERKATLFTSEREHQLPLWERLMDLESVSAGSVRLERQRSRQGEEGVSLGRNQAVVSGGSTVKDFDRAVARDARRYNGAT